jgi:hypothetical protein
MGSVTMPDVPRDREASHPYCHVASHQTGTNASAFIRRLADGVPQFGRGKVTQSRRPIMIHRSLSFAAIAAGVFLAAAYGVPDTPQAPRQRILFEDHFNGKLGDGWFWVHEDKENWRIEGGKLQIRATGGSSFREDHDGKNYLLRTPPDVKDGELSIEAYVENKPTDQWEYAGLYWFYDDDHYVSLNKERNNYGHRTSIMFGIEKDGKGVTSFPAPTYEAEGVWLRFRVKGTQIIGEYRAQSTDPWREVGHGELPVKGPPRVGFHAGRAPKKELNRWASFSHFKIADLVKE